MVVTLSEQTLPTLVKTTLEILILLEATLRWGILVKRMLLLHLVGVIVHIFSTKFVQFINN